MADETRPRREIGEHDWDSGMRLGFGAAPGARAEIDTPPSTPASRFHLHGEIARDATSVLLRGRDVEMDREVSLRVLEAETDVSGFLERVQIGAQLQHPGIVPVYAFGLLEDGRAYVARRLVEGDTFADLVTRDTGAQRLFGILEQAAHALAFAHARGVAHGHVTAERIVVGPHGEVVLTGWDRAVRANGDPAPIREDVRALGALLASLNGRGLPAGREPPRHAGEIARDIGAHLAREETHACEAEIAAASEWLWAEEERTREATARRRAERARRAKRRTLWLAAAALLVLTVGLGGLGWRWTEDRAAGSTAAERVAAALREASRHEAARRWAESLSWARTAVAVAAEAGEETLDRARARLDEIARRTRVADGLLARLEGIDSHGDLDGSRTRTEFASALAACGIDLLELHAEEAANRLRWAGDPVRVAAAVDEWANLASREEELLPRIVQVASLLDPDPGRIELRLAPWRRDAEKLEDLASRVDIARASPATLETLGWMLSYADRPEVALDLFRRGRRRHPGDPRFLAVHGLLATNELEPDPTIEAGPTIVLTVPGDPRADEAVAPHTALVALRPDDGCGWHVLGLLLTGRDSAASLAAHRRSVGLEPEHAHHALYLARALADLGELEEAATACRLALERGPEHALVHHQIGVLMATVLDDEDGAEASFRRALEMDPNLAPAHAGLGRLRLQQGRFEPAEDRCRKAIEIDPRTRYAHQYLGMALRNQGKLDGAVRAFRAAIEIDPEDGASHIGLGSILCDHRRDFADAVRHFEIARRLEPRIAVVHQNLGNALRGLGDLVRAEASYRRAVEVAPESAWAHALLGGFLLEQRRLDEGIEMTLRAVELDSTCMLAQLHLGHHHRERNRLDAAAAAYRKAIECATPESQPDANAMRAYLARARSGLGVVLDGQGRHERALELCEDAAERQPRDASLHVNLGIVYAQQGHLRDAIASYRKAHALAPADPVPLLNLGQALAMTSDRAGAIEACRSAIRLGGPTSALARVHLGAALLNGGHLDEAIATLDEAAKLCPDSFDAHCSLGLALARRGIGDRAEKSLLRARELRPEDPRPWRHLGSMYLIGGRRPRPREAVLAFRKAFELAPGMPGARKLLSQALVALAHELTQNEDHRGAVDAFRQALKTHQGNVMALNGLAWLLATAPAVEIRKPAEAVRLAEEAVAATGGKAGTIWNTLGVARYRAGKFREALEALLKSRRLQGPANFSFDGFFLAMAHARLGQMKEARDWYDRSVLWMDASAQDDVELKRFRTEAEAVLRPKPK